MIVSGILREGVSSLRAVRFLFSFLMSCGLRRAFCGAAAVDGTLLRWLGCCGSWSSRRCGIDLCFVSVRGGGVGGAVVEVDVDFLRWCEARFQFFEVRVRGGTPFSLVRAGHGARSCCAVACCAGAVR